MDPFTSLLGGPRARDAFALRASLSPPWSLRILAESPLTLLAVVRGHAWVIPDAGAPVRLAMGDVAVTRGPDHYSVADDPSTPTRVVIHPGQHCRSPEGESLSERMTLGVRTWGNHPQGETLMLVGAYEATGDISARLRQALPPLLSLTRDEWSSPLVALLCDEMSEDRPGQAAVLDRLLDLLLTAVLRTWFARPEASTPGASPPQADPVVGHAVRLLHADPAHPWTLERLAQRLGVSRAALARRFHEVVGQPPMTFLTEWRLALAADLLSAPKATLGSVAARVGYSTPYALSSAFKRVRGISPREHRARVMDGGA
ncbi:AraC family transcriptional regulator [Thiorhodococcus mannitoliphagus]|uniref:AraC family transcriptional regulator n=1 Tax=Thiorhodococcus mannitoliphagus TaxID=329406 RepID=A0A6P1DT03_9GAMM|nr:AraC family transcriptional regulator [Thiorhodococcus mannitoliphagus]NEX20949.1 AraC family transcriptional regulator [Thiorhodococcus mannitoliphagus]